MPRYFFDIHDNESGLQRDEDGVEIAEIEQVRQEAKRLLPLIARDELPKNGDSRTYTVLVTDEEGRPVYSATLNFAGLWLQRNTGDGSAADTTR